jgi:hypothetical protein
MSQKNELVGWFPCVLADLIIEYGKETLCDLLSTTFPTRFVMIEPAAIGDPYGDLSAKWFVKSPSDPSDSVESDDGDTCFGGLVCSPYEIEYFSTFFDDYKSKIAIDECQLLLVRPAEQDSQFLLVHKPTHKLYLLGVKLIDLDQEEIASVGHVYESPSTLLRMLLREGTLEI